MNTTIGTKVRKGERVAKVIAVESSRVRILTNAGEREWVDAVEFRATWRVDARKV